MKIEIGKEFPGYFKSLYPEEFQLFSHFETTAAVPGAFLGGLILGVIEMLARTYISTKFADAIVFGVLIVVLLVRPAGLLGKQINEKV